MNKNIPQSVIECLWSYDISKMDFIENKDRIITNVLNYGNNEAVKWMFSVYKKEEIQRLVENPLPGEWDKKSLNFWSLIFGVRPSLNKRFV